MYSFGWWSSLQLHAGGWLVRVDSVSLACVQDLGFSADEAFARRIRGLRLAARIYAHRHTQMYEL